MFVANCIQWSNVYRIFPSLTNVAMNVAWTLIRLFGLLRSIYLYLTFFFCLTVNVSKQGNGPLSISLSEYVLLEKILDSKTIFVCMCK